MKIALCGIPYAGKTTAARELVVKHRWSMVDYGGLLKIYVADALIAAGIETTLQDQYDNKAKYRRLQQVFGDAIGFGTFNAERYIDAAIALYTPKAAPERNMVFDCVRTPEQWTVLKDRGYKVVRLVCSREVQVERAYRHGCSPDDIEAVLSDPLEQGLPEVPCLEVDTSKSRDILVSFSCNTR